MTGSAKQSMDRQTPEWIASSLPLLAMTRQQNSRRHCCRRPLLIEKPYRLFRIFEFRRGLQCLLGGVHRCQPFVVLVVVANVERCGRYRDIALAHSQETTNRQDQRVDLMVLDGDVGDLADRLILLVI